MTARSVNRRSRTDDGKHGLMVGSRAPGPYTGTICSGGGLVRRRRPTLGGVAGRSASVDYVAAAMNITLNNQNTHTQKDTGRERLHAFRQDVCVKKKFRTNS